jgi:hypothetical protein
MKLLDAVARLLGRKTPVAPTEESEPTGPSTRLVISYCDAKGDFTRRRITLKRIAPRGHDLLVLAYCHERRAPRHFLASRILECVDAETGEVFTDATGYLYRHRLFCADTGAASGQSKDERRRIGPIPARRASPTAA